jgi:hypothetical protein
MFYSCNNDCKFSLTVCKPFSCLVVAVIVLMGLLTTIANAANAAEPFVKSMADEKSTTIDVLLLGYYIWANPQYIELAKQKGINIYGPMTKDPTAANPANYPLSFLKKFHVIVASGPLEKQWDPHSIPGAINPGIVDNLLEYNRQGGGLMWIPLAAGYGAEAWNQSIGSHIDAVALDEALQDSTKDVSVSLMSSFRDRLRYIWTTDITPHEVTEGVRGLFFGEHGEWGWPGTIPMKYGDSWTVLIRGMDSTRTTVNGTPSSGSVRQHTRSDTTGTYTSHPQLIAIKSETNVRNGRMLLQPIYTTWTWGNFGHPAMKDAFLFNGDGIHHSDGEKFLNNSWKWLAQPALGDGTFGGYQPPKSTHDKPLELFMAEWERVDFSKENNQPELNGIIGAQSLYGGGEGTVAQWANAARSAGLDYLIFTDEFTLHTPETYSKLVAECKNESSENLTMIPGWGAKDINDVYRFFPGAPNLPDRNKFDSQGRIIYPAAICLDYGWRIGQIASGLKKMPYNPWWEHVIMSVAPLVYENTKLLDDSVQLWLENCEANNMHLLPVSLVHLKNPDILGVTVKESHRTVFKTRKKSEIIDFMRLGFGGGVMPSYMTQGPQLPIWRIETSPNEPFAPNSSRFRIILKATSDVGISHIRMIDANDGSNYRLWNCNGKKVFEAVVDESTDRQYVLGLIVTDVNGHTAIASPVANLMGANRVWHMTDRLMGLQHARSWDSDRKLLVSHETPLGIGYHKGSTDSADEFTTNHRSTLKFKGLEGSGIYPPAFKLAPLADTSMGKELNLSNRYTLSLASQDLTVIEKKGETKLCKNERFNFRGTPPRREDTQFTDIETRSWLIRQRYMSSVTMMVNQITVTFKKDLILNSLYLGRYSGVDAPGEFDTLFIKDNADEPTAQWHFEPKESFNKYTEFSPGGYLYQEKALAGTMGFIALDDKIACESQARTHTFVLSKKYCGQYKAGQKLVIRMLRIGRSYHAQIGNCEWIEQLLHDYGIGTQPSYSYKIPQGTLKQINYIMDLDQQMGGSVIEVEKYDMPSPLPVRVVGVRKTAVLGEYDLDTMRMRPLPYFEGSVTTSIETQLKDTRLYIGELLSWDNSKIRVSMVSDKADFLIEIHNPTDIEQVCKLTGSNGFTPLKDYSETITLPANSSKKKKLISTHDSVKMVPFK